MLHPAISQAIATAHIEDLHRAAKRSHTIRLVRRVAHAPHVGGSTKTLLVRLRPYLRH
jgi:hypothetical protein